jgi:proteasome lid subunit RPN8/RPN11
VTTAAEEVAGELAAGDAAAARASASEQLAAERVDAQGQVALNKQVVRADGTRPWGPCRDPIRADAVEAQLLSEAQSFSFQVNYSEIPVDSFFHIRTVISTEDLVLVSENWKTECSISVAPTEVQFYRSSVTDIAKIEVKPGDVISYHSHPGINEVMASVDDLKGMIKGQTDMVIVSRRADGGVAEMKYTVTEAQELLDLLAQGDLKGYFSRFEAKYHAQKLDTTGTVLEENMRKQGMIP